MKVGRRLAIKILNAARFALLQAEPRGPITEPLDRGMLTALAHLVAESTQELEDYDYARALQSTEAFFWGFCDDYLELVKSRRYGDFGSEAAASANSAMLIALDTLMRLFAPFLPFVTEEVWSWWRPGSVHSAAWPTHTGVVANIGGADMQALVVREATQDALSEVRRIKSLLKKPTKAAIATAVLPSAFAGLQPASRDFQAATHIRDLRFADVAEAQRNAGAIFFAPLVRVCHMPAKASGPVRFSLSKKTMMAITFSCRCGLPRSFSIMATGVRHWKFKQPAWTFTKYKTVSAPGSVRIS